MPWTEQEARQALDASDLLEVGMAADQVRRALHPENVVTYALAAPASLTLEEAAREEAEHGAAAVILAETSGARSFTLPQWLARLQCLHDAPPGLSFHQLPIAMNQALLADALEPLHKVGVRSILLEFAASSALSLEWTPFLRAAAALHIGVSIAYTIGQGESPAVRARDLASIHALQQETQAMQSVTVRIHHALTAEARREEEATAVDYLKTLAVTRLVLNNIEHVQAEWSVMGPKVLELALRFGANDAGSVPWSQTGGREPSHHGGESELRRVIRDAGFRPVERDALFRQSLLR